MVIKLKEIAPSPEAIDTMQDDNEQRIFVLTFRELTKYLQSLKTFVEFSQNRSMRITRVNIRHFIKKS